MEAAAGYGDLLHGEVVRLATTGAVLRTGAPLALLANLKIHLPSPQCPDEPLGDLYAKVVAQADDGFQIRFTAVPQDVAEAIQGFCAG